MLELGPVYTIPLHILLPLTRHFRLHPRRCAHLTPSGYTVVTRHNIIVFSGTI